MQDSHLLLDRLVGPLSVQVEVLYSHEASHASVEFLVLHILQRVDLEVRMVEGGSLDLRKQHDEQVRGRELELLRVLLQANRLG